MPLREYIGHLYFKRFGKERPDVVLSIEEKVRLGEAKKARRREVKMKVRLDSIRTSSLPKTCFPAISAFRPEVRPPGTGHR